MAEIFPSFGEEASDDRRRPTTGGVRRQEDDGVVFANKLYNRLILRGVNLLIRLFANLLINGLIRLYATAHPGRSGRTYVGIILYGYG